VKNINFYDFPPIYNLSVTQNETSLLNIGGINSLIGHCKFFTFLQLKKTKHAVQHHDTGMKLVWEEVTT